MKTVEEHATHVLACLSTLEQTRSVDVSVADALGRVTAVAIDSPVDLPLFRNSQMDGYAVRATSIRTVPATLAVTHVAAAGPAEKIELAPGSAVKIMTGAPVPEGADAIVPVEHTTATADSVTVEVTRRPGDFVREQGSDVSAGMRLVDRATLLEPRHIAVLAAVGLSRVTVVARPRVAVITTGAELVDGGTSLRPGQIFDSNGVTLASHLRVNGAEVVGVYRSSDDHDEFRSTLTTAAASADLILTSGGVSMGDFEVVKDVLGPAGGRFGPVKMQPGGPQGTSEWDGVPILNFPGNPVSTVVSFVVFARNALRAAAGLAPLERTTASLNQSLKSVPGKRQFLRARRTAGGGVELVAGPGSHLVAAMAWADVLLDIPAETTELKQGDDVQVWAL